jgi:hypothetical protein
MIEGRMTIMTKEFLLNTVFSSAYQAMFALNAFLVTVDSLPNDSRANYQNLKVVGNRIYE